MKTASLLSLRFFICLIIGIIMAIYDDIRIVRDFFKKIEFTKVSTNQLVTN